MGQGGEGDSRAKKARKKIKRREIFEEAADEKEKEKEKKGTRGWDGMGYADKKKHTRSKWCTAESRRVSGYAQ